MISSEARHCVHLVEPYKWLNRKLNVVAQGQFGMYDVYIVQEPGYNGDIVDDGIIIFSQED